MRQQTPSTDPRSSERAFLRATRAYASAPVLYFHPKADQDDPWAETERAYDRRDARSTVTFYARRSF